MALVQIRSPGNEDALAAPSGLAFSPDLREIRALRGLDETVRMARELIQDNTFPTARAWVKGGGHAAAFFPVYTPQELAHALGLLPVTLHGGGEELEITHADAALGSFLCSISKSTLELAITGRLDPFGAFVFPYICDVSRNLEGIFSRLRPNAVTHMLHLPQNFTSSAAVPFLVAEYRRLLEKLERVAKEKYDPSALTDSLQVYQQNRDLLRQLTELRRKEPWKLPSTELYFLERLGDLVPAEVQTPLLRHALDEARERSRPKRDAVRVLVVGPFCEQPTPDLLALIEEAGCYVVGDEFNMLRRWTPKVELSGDPLENLARAYIESKVDIGVRATPMPKGESIVARVGESEAQGVLFLTAKFCEPALEDVVLYRRGLEEKKVPYLHLEFEEKSTSYEQSRLQVETFVESVLFD
ncbi:MAG: 2-hydroxyacyl-CoA dehydratase [Euryarchaeota archaeon]|nr:2-hydroxyacyl-CoA dehydratase [Euryarchaeota archaeon]MDE1835390.1 2-hydroxyacyl-CoA dehydratase [Euryarchaeota archaeon]MDE1880493.1 2-hydroxyacyl-CoA dehydratase [Euryarchaeota archaeon]MDE2043686.1 2-hydroxyacyl-CoA dehydratase [Thermoplasmata archaeon]